MSNGRRREREVGGVVRHGIKDNFAFGFTSIAQSERLKNLFSE